MIAGHAAIHKTKDARAVADKKGLKLCFIPPYSPWFNPVEFSFSMVKGHYRNLRVRKDSPIDDQIRESIDATVTASKCERFFEQSRGVWVEKHQVATLE